MKFFFDENFPKKATSLLEEKGHQTFDVRGTNLEGSDDLDIFKISQEHEAVFLTTDKDFFHTIHFLYETHFGIVVIALSQPNTPSILEKLKIGLDYIEKNGIHSKCLLLTDNRIYQTTQS